MTARQWAEVQGSSSGSSYGDREYGERWSRDQRRNPMPGSDHLEHYAEKAEAREREQRKAQEDREWTESSRARDEREVKLLTFRASDPEPWPLGLPSPGDPVNDIFEASVEQQDWQRRRDEYLLRAEGEELAARISRR
ncbi:hypothetical protein ACFY15_31930 [Streptomyces sp. NPDC001373]|uniref:hypothetical protein n=1 Tax=Streptomyces sp. NPDC001373 TaxID=3364565 RepID=UPI0036CAE44C